MTTTPVPAHGHGVRALLTGLVIAWVVLAAAIAIAAALMPSVEVDGGPLALLGVAAVLGLVNALVGPVLRLLSVPLTIMTLGLFTLVINGVLLGIAAWISDDLDVGGPVSVIVGALLISVIATVLGLVLSRVLD